MTTSGLPPWPPLAALQFLTRIPVRLSAAPDIGRAVPWFPAVGAVIGAIVGGAVAGLAHVVPPVVAAAVGVVVGLAVTGGFHEDGLADTADAMGGTTAERRREILKDSRHGTYGVIALVASIGVRVACLASIGPAAAFAAAVSAHTLGRGAAVALVAVDRPMTLDGLAGTSSRSVRRSAAVIGIGVGVLIGALAAGWWVGPFVAAAAVAAVAIGRLAIRSFGGIGGDHLGAAEQVAECLILVVASGLATRHPVWWT